MDFFGIFLLRINSEIYITCEQCPLVNTANQASYRVMWGTNGFVWTTWWRPDGRTGPRTPPGGRGGGQSLNYYIKIARKHLYRLIIHKNDPLAKLDIMDVVWQMCAPPWGQGRGSKIFYVVEIWISHLFWHFWCNIASLYIKMILRPSPTWWWCSRTSNSTLINARAANH